MRLLLVGALVLGCAGAALAQEGGQERIDPPSASPPQDRGEPSAPAAPSQTGGKAGEGAVGRRAGGPWALGPCAAQIAGEEQTATHEQ